MIRLLKFLVLNTDLFCKKIRSNGGLILIWEFLVDILVHKGGFSNARITQNDNFQQDLFTRCHFCGSKMGKKLNMKHTKGKIWERCETSFILFCDIRDHRIVKEKGYYNFWTLHIEHEPVENLIENSFSRKYPWKIYVMMGVFSLLALSLFLRLWRTFLT